MSDFAWSLLPTLLNLTTTAINLTTLPPYDNTQTLVSILPLGKSQCVTWARCTILVVAPLSFPYSFLQEFPVWLSLLPDLFCLVPPCASRSLPVAVDLRPSVLSPWYIHEVLRIRSPADVFASHPPNIQIFIISPSHQRHQQRARHGVCTLLARIRRRCQTRRRC